MIVYTKEDLYIYINGYINEATIHLYINTNVFMEICRSKYASPFLKPFDLLQTQDLWRPTSLAFTEAHGHRRLDARLRHLLHKYGDGK